MFYKCDPAIDVVVKPICMLAFALQSGLLGKQFLANFAAHSSQAAVQITGPISNMLYHMRNIGWMHLWGSVFRCRAGLRIDLAIHDIDFVKKVAIQDALDAPDAITYTNVDLMAPLLHASCGWFCPVMRERY